MLNGKLGIERADNGWILSWYETRRDVTTCVEGSREVYSDAFDCLSRIAEVAGIVSGEAAARAVCGMVESAHIDSAGQDPAVDDDVAALMPDHAPPAAYAGD
jgi:hypothetical protein